MAIQQPQPTDKLNSPSHSQLHRAVAVDSSTPDETVVVEANSVTVKDATAFYFGDKSTNGSWRLVRDGDNLNVERREGGTWVYKGKFLP